MSANPWAAYQLTERTWTYITGSILARGLTAVKMLYRFGYQEISWDGEVIGESYREWSTHSIEVANDPVGQKARKETY